MIIILKNRTFHSQRLAKVHLCIFFIISTVSAPLKPRGSIFQNGFLTPDYHIKNHIKICSKVRDSKIAISFGKANLCLLLLLTKTCYERIENYRNIIMSMHAQFLELHMYVYILRGLCRPY